MADRCPLPRELESYAASEVGPPEIGAHVSGCAACRAAVEDIRENQAFLRRAAPVLAGSLTRPSSSHMDEVPGFELTEEICRGGQGVVFRAVQLDTKRPAAVKMLLAGAFATRRQQQRFDREIEIAARLRHPNIITVFDSGETANGCRYVAMEFVEGIPLDTFVARSLSSPGHRGKPEIDVAVRLMAAVASAVAYAHTSGVIHRDLKPSNVLVDSDGNPRVLDFGLARPTDSHADATLTQEFAGTPAYAAPEQFSSGAAAVDARSDVYSLGMMLYRILTGEFAYPCDGSFADVARHAASTPPSPLAKFASRIPKDLETIVLKCLTKHPARRYASAAALEADLNHYLRDEAIDARRDSAWYMLRKAAAQNRRLLIAAGIVVAIVLGNAYLLVQQMVGARAAQLRAGLEQQRADAEAVRSEAIAQITRYVIPPGDLFVDGMENTVGRLVYDGLARFEAQLEFGAYSSRPEFELALRSTLAGIFSDTPALTGQGEIAIRHTLASRRRVFGPDHVETARSHHELAEVLLVRGRFGEADKSCRTALDIRGRKLGAASADTARSEELLARILVKLGNAGPAVEAADRAAAVLTQPGRTPREKAAALRTQADALHAAGQTDRAVARASEALRWSVADLADEDALLASCISMMGTLADQQDNRVSDPSPLPAGLSTLGELLRQTPGPDHSNTLEQLLLVRRALLPPKHPAIHRALVALASRYFVESNNVRGAACLIEALPILEAEYGPSDIAVANLMEQIGYRLAYQFRYAEAVAYFARSRAIWLRQPKLERDDLTIAAATRYYGLYLGYAGDWSAAEAMSRESLDRFKVAVGDDHYAFAMASAQRAWALAELDRVAEAEPLARAAATRAAASHAIPGDQRTWTNLMFGLVLVRGGLAEEGAALLAPALDDFDGHRQIYPVHPFAWALRDAYELIGDEERLRELDACWGDVLARQFRIDPPPDFALGSGR